MGDLGRRVHQQGRLPDTRLPAHEDEAPGHDPTPQDSVELAPGQRAARRGVTRDLTQGNGFRIGAPRFCAGAARGRLAHLEFLERVPRLAVRALAGPAEALAATVRAYKSDRGLGHGGTTYHPAGGFTSGPVAFYRARSFDLMRGTESTPAP